MELKLYQKNILSMLIIAGAGFILFNIAFVLAALVLRASMGILGLPQDASPPLLAE